MIILNRQAVLNRMLQRGYSQAQLQAKTGLSGYTIQRYINAENARVHLANIKKLAEALHCPPLELIDGAIGTL